MDIVERFYNGEEAKSLLIEQADEITKLRAELAEAKKDGYLAGLEAAANRCEEVGRQYAITAEDYAKAIRDLIDAAMRTAGESSVDGRRRND